MKGRKYFTKGEFNSKLFDKDFPTGEKCILADENSEPIYKLDCCGASLGSLNFIKNNYYYPLEEVEQLHDVYYYLNARSDFNSVQHVLEYYNKERPKKDIEIADECGVTKSNIGQRRHEELAKMKRFLLKKDSQLPYVWDPRINWWE